MRITATIHPKTLEAILAFEKALVLFDKRIAKLENRVAPQKTRITEETVQMMKKLKEEGHTFRSIATRCGVSLSTVWRFLKKDK